MTTELDKAVAEAIDDVAPHDWEHTGLCDHYLSVYQCSRCRKNDLVKKHVLNEEDCIRSFSTDWNAVMFAAEKVGLVNQDDDNRFIISRETFKDLPDPWSAGVEYQIPWEGWQQGHPYADHCVSGPTAICKAILELKGKSL